MTQPSTWRTTLRRKLIRPRSGKPTRSRRNAALRSAKGRIRGAIGYLNLLLAEPEELSECMRQVVAQDVMDLLEDARNFVRRSMRNSNLGTNRRRPSRAASFKATVPSL